MKNFTSSICLKNKNNTFIATLVMLFLLVGTKCNAAKTFSSLLVLFLFFSFQGNAATKTWNINTAGDWQVAANWTGGLPIAGDDIVINK